MVYSTYTDTKLWGLVICNKKINDVFIAMILHPSNRNYSFTAALHSTNQTPVLVARLFIATHQQYFEPKVET